MKIFDVSVQIDFAVQAPDEETVKGFVIESMDFNMVKVHKGTLKITERNQEEPEDA